MTITFELNLRTVLRWLLAALFIWAALSKLGNLQDFYTSLVAYQLPIPGLVLRVVATTLPWVELFCGLMLLTRFWFRPAVLCSLLLAAAAVYLLRNERAGTSEQSVAAVSSPDYA